MTTTVPSDFEDLLETPTAALATIGPSGRPQVSAVWFLWDSVSGTIQISLNDSRQKVRNLLENPKATLFILDPANPQRSLEIRGDVQLEPDTDYAFAAKERQKYGVDPHTFDAPGDTRSIATLRPARIVPTLIG
jgi:PPOX class probable F420-dependent enzyme